jgi:cephalosporin hydroxylase
MTPQEEFNKERAAKIEEMGRDADFVSLSLGWLNYASPRRYSYHFDWLGRPIIQYPQDIVAFQEIVWSVRPDVIVETGIAHGGSLILSASLLAMLDLADAEPAGETIDPRKPRRRVVGVDIDIRAHNRAAIEAHPLRHAITMIQGSSIDPAIADEVRAAVGEAERVLVVFDSNHTHEHVLGELELYAPLATPGSYCIVYDTVVEDLPADMFPDRPWGPGDNPKTAVWEYLKSHPEFEIDRAIHHKLGITVAPDGFLRRTA